MTTFDADPNKTRNQFWLPDYETWRVNSNGRLSLIGEVQFTSAKPWWTSRNKLYFRVSVRNSVGSISMIAPEKPWALCFDRQDAMKRALTFLRKHIPSEFESVSVFEQVIEDGVPFNCETAD